jgi:hypothetical protein
MIDGPLAHLSGRGSCAPADAGHFLYPDLARIDATFQSSRQGIRAFERTRDAVAYTDSHRCRFCLSFADNVEVVVKARDFIDLGLRKTHFLCQRTQMARL